ncbi:LOW QUALITY PROTEIN: hypothetical protein IFM47457_06405 [Aspergillus lentulus]|nr:LOW QUALITY PROTEIN: hypothetical protein IFM47457_06405 [Aspergillus lentulus]
MANCGARVVWSCWDPLSSILRSFKSSGGLTATANWIPEGVDVVPGAFHLMCNSIIEELPQLAAQFHDLLETFLLPAATRPADTGDTIESAERSDGNDAEAEVIQQHAEDTL